MHELAQLAEDVDGVARGVALLLSIIERDTIAADFEDEEPGRPDAAVLGVTDTGTALRFALVASHLLADRAGRAGERAMDIAAQRGVGETA